MFTSYMRTLKMLQYAVYWGEIRDEKKILKDKISHDKATVQKADTMSRLE